MTTIHAYTGDQMTQDGPHKKVTNVVRVRTQTSYLTQQVLQKQSVHHQAVAEAFGYYFDAQGNVVYKVKTIGLQLEDLETKDFIFVQVDNLKVKQLKLT